MRINVLQPKIVLYNRTLLFISCFSITREILGEYTYTYDIILGITPFRTKWWINLFWLRVQHCTAGYPHVTLRASISDGFIGRPIYYRAVRIYIYIMHILIYVYIQMNVCMSETQNIEFRLYNYILCFLRIYEIITNWYNQKCPYLRPVNNIIHCVIINVIAKTF